MAFARALRRRHSSLFSAAAAPSLTSLFSSSSSSALAAAPAPAPPQANPPEDSTDKLDAAPGTAPTSAPASRRKTKAAEKPMEIPYQAKVANLVHLVGSIGEPLVPVTTKDGIPNAVSVLVDRKDSEIPLFWIPIIFRGEQAEIAINHVKENDMVYVTGELCDCGHVPSDLSEVKINSTHQVLIHTLSFVKDFITNKKDNHSVVQSTSDEVKNTSNKPYVGNKSQNGALAGPSAPIQKDIRDEPNQPIEKEKQNWPNPPLGKGKQDRSGPWKDLIDNPHEWADNRMKKQEGVVKPRFPDFSHKTTREGVWIDSLPESVLRKIYALFPTPGSEIEQGASTSRKPAFDAGSKFGQGNYTSNKPAFSPGSKFGQGTYTSNKSSFSSGSMPAQENKLASSLSSKFEQGASNSKNPSRDQLWRDLAYNPDKWYDNRSKKSKPNQPDFKNKDTGEALWLSNVPEWMNSMLPPPEAS